MESYEKVYVAMHLYVDESGDVRPTALVWEDGRRYEIDRVLSVFASPPAHVGGVLTKRYEVEITGFRREIYLETRTNRWFVEKPVLKS